ncbi:hypothetical protein A3J43_00240 [Candidatus Uhrbacteria bacterium RIFCSPHIGHO2_12_FULL_54_23]|uniref:Cytosol aminopeptidase domain-containing protein n=3 Tax=Candidatus Uhriibacteriota TaxID=1752732 RepID=A0A1F7UFR3_9BACT|nr:MAG: hypothetical protein A3J43_00240 [Candidatus Uhrbacteria bacterium RIFCSPHIGHO2_12_FULL_54_23]OGL85516.1 MAG: hypothetical protein A3B36_00880 [Candidatus Uhrbacteria bacterium RIFCSPLOWO2_01_FULL_55_36]OGL89647.1 MAG: hypothetical protein A3J36_02105 [Candidatus Uhrbacteria bacterium RIFCSPLOWO2_02_FULL_54_37]
MNASLSTLPPAAPEIARISFALRMPSALVRHPSGGVTLEIGTEQRVYSHRTLRLLLRRTIVEAKAHHLRRLALNPDDLPRVNPRLTPTALGEMMAVHFEMANFEFVQYKTPPQEGWRFVEEVHIFGPRARACEKGYRKGQLIGEAINAARTLADTPANHLTPRLLVQKTVQHAKGANVRVKILGKKEIKALKMGGILAVAQGSSEEPRLIVLEYHGGQKTQPPIALVGKAVTFDSGGLNIKPRESILPTSLMHLDMGAGAAVIETVLAAARLKLKTNVIGIVPTAENMPSGTSYRPGDIVTMMNGATVEILNTDGEGRLLLADALTYAAHYQPRLVIDIATLTSAAVIALGFRAAAFFTRNERLAKIIEAVGETSGDYVWRLPIWEEYEEDLKGTFADLANIQKGQGAGAIAGAVFLHYFAKTFPAWAHLDIAPRIIAAEGEYLARGFPGAPVRLLIKLLEKYQQ